MSTVLLHTLDVSTDSFAGLYVENVTFSTITVSWTNVSQDKAQFRIVDEASTVVSADVQVEGSAKGSVTISGLSVGATYKYYLERYEIDTWIRQTSTTSSIDYVEAQTLTSSPTIAVSSTSAKITWPNPISGQTYKIVYAAVDDNDTEPIDTIEITPENATGDVTISNLDQGVTYRMLLVAMESGENVTVSDTPFTTSSAASMDVVEGPMASYIVLDWSNSVDGQGSNYRIVNRDASGTDAILLESSTETMGTIKNLTPGESYNFVLQRLELDGTWDDQTTVSTTALSSSMSVGSIGSTTLELNWTPISDSSEYEVLYSSGTSVQGSGRTTELVAVLRDLSPNTSYKLDLVTYELGETVGISSLGASTEQSFTQSYGMIIAGIIALVIALIAIKMRS